MSTFEFRLTELLRADPARVVKALENAMKKIIKKILKEFDLN